MPIGCEMENLIYSRARSRRKSHDGRGRYRMGLGEKTASRTETGTGNENLREAAGAETTRSSRLLSSQEPGTSRSKDSR